MTSTGEFLNVPWKGKKLPLIGNEIEFDVPFTGSYFYSKNFIALVASVAILLLTIPFISEYIFPNDNNVIAYVSMDINPSLELGINNEEKVIIVKGLNNDGIKLLEKIQLNNLSVEDAVKVVTREAIKNEYLAVDNENSVILTLTAQKEHELKLENIQNEIRTAIKEELKEQKIEGQVELINISMEFRERAGELGISSGKYAVLLEAVSEGLEISVEDVRTSSVVKAIKAAGGNPGQIISQTKKEAKRLFDLEKKIKTQENKEKGLGDIEGSTEIEEKSVLNGNDIVKDTTKGNSVKNTAVVKRENQGSKGKTGINKDIKDIDKDREKVNEDEVSLENKLKRRNSN